MKTRASSPVVTVLLAAASLFVFIDSAESAPLQIDALRASDVKTDGVYWIWSLPKSASGKGAEVAELDMATNELVIRVDGELQRLIKRSATWTPDRQTGPRVGDTCVEVWGNSTYVVELAYEMTKSDDEYSVFNGKMEVSLSSTAVRAGLKGSPAVLDIEGETGS